MPTPTPATPVLRTASASTGAPAAHHMTASGAAFPSEPVQNASAANQLTNADVQTFQSDNQISRHNFKLAMMAATAAQGFTILGGVNGGGKTRMAMDFAARLTQMQKDVITAVIPVRPSWKDVGNLLDRRRAFPEGANGDFAGTDFHHALVQCNQDPQKRAVVILDEMNLAPAESYLAEVLSATDLPGKALIPCGDGHCYGMPKSLFIIGTASSDPSALPFSSRILDRGFYIRFRTDDIVLSENEYYATTLDSTIATFLSLSRGEYADITKAMREKLKADFRLEYLLDAINTIPGNYTISMSYRMLNAMYDFMTSFICLSGRSGYDPEMALCAFDWAVVSKVLPKFQGNKEHLKAPLEVLERELQNRGLISQGPSSPWIGRARKELTYLRYQITENTPDVSYR